MKSIDIILATPRGKRTIRFEEHSLMYEALAGVASVVELFLPDEYADLGHRISILSASTDGGEDIAGVSIKKLVDEGVADIRIFDQKGEPVTADQQLLNQIVLVDTSKDSTIEMALGEKEGRDPVVVSGAAQAQPKGKRVDVRAVLRHSEFVSRSANTAKGIRIRIWEDALRKAFEHAEESLEYEVGGICIGKYEPDSVPSRRTVEITDTFIGKHVISRRASITFTADTWSSAMNTVDEEYAYKGEEMIGWYHTHPSYGVFLSGDDLFFHENFFVQPWHVALVIDPVAQSAGFFAWDESHKSVLPCAPDAIEVLSGRHAKPPRSESTTAPMSQSGMSSDPSISATRNEMPGDHTSPSTTEEANGSSSVGGSKELTGIELIQQEESTEQQGASSKKEDLPGATMQNSGSQDAG